MTADWWRFVPSGDALPSASAIAGAAAIGRGALGRELREARAVLGTSRAASLLRLASAEAPRPFGEPFRLLLVTTQQPQALEETLRLAFAIAGFSVEIRAIEGLLDLRATLADPSSDRLADADLSLVFVPDATGESDALVADLAARLAARTLAPVAVARFSAGGAVPHGAGHGVIPLDLPTGGAAVFDTRFASTFGTILKPDAADRLADAAAGLAARLKGKAPKLVVTDLDETLWGGVLGEAGGGAPTLRYAYAEALAALRLRGFVLALASRNDAAEVERHFATLDDAPLGIDDFSACSIGWSDKPSLVADVLERLGLSSGHTVFIDDDPVNCAKVAARFPDMDVRRYAGESFAQALLADPLLAGAQPADAPLRAEQYGRRAAVERLRADAADDAVFLHSLKTEVTIEPLATDLLPRAAELAARVNQFRFTALRPNLVQLGTRQSGLDFMARLDDAFGAHGLVGLVLASQRGDAAMIDAFCLSCRALQRRVESAMLHALALRARELGLTRILGRIEILERNEPARDCLARHGFAERNGEWQVDLTGRAAALDSPPQGIAMIDRLNGRHA
ncbi:hypothetical protein Sa4125_28270 [Aureimonas sp. SA4125]|uniref:HAD-IIIC family phosphatase n=1 Tax=Aureimonas sp. SA4125 TaxID=2826993 RepID=UPI001CC63EC5|nr:HAD-IIIC family phosphatase [Aureimonas sp. SA4125]BDA85285.1 hypothetical protein Sa4125_28270 [Aureimonas sp. SA4125]